MSGRVRMVGCGLVSALGDSLESTWTAVIDGQCIWDHAPTVLGARPLIDLARRAASEALAQAQWCDLSDTALVFATSKGAILDWITPPPAAGYRTLDVESGREMGLATTAAHLAAELHLGGPYQTISAACASGLHALALAYHWIHWKVARRVLVVAGEASVHPLFVGSFKRLGVLAAAGEGCRPFDHRRGGFYMSEAAAAICLQAAQPGQDSNAPWIDRVAWGADATHLTGQDPRGRLLGYLLEQTAAGQPVQLVHAHGTGTILNDAVEWEALHKHLSGAAEPVQVYSHKAALGHSQGAAGLVAAVLSMRMHQTGQVPPNPLSSQSLTSPALILSTAPVRRRINNSLLIAAGFGGAAAVICLKSG